MPSSRTPIRTLRKACLNCTKAKRKCIVQLPACIRCLTKGLYCTYDLEPLTSQSEELIVSKPTQDFLKHYLLGVIEPQQSDNRDDIAKESTQAFSDFCYLGAAAHAQRFRFVVSGPAFWNRLGYVLWAMDRTQGLVSSGERNALVHPKLQFFGERDYLENLHGVLSTPENDSLDELLKVNVSEVPLHDAITAIQTLILYLIKYLFKPDPVIQSSVRSHLALLADWTQLLLSTASTRMPSGLSPWQAWLLGETTRRTIVLSFCIPLAYEGLKYGVCGTDLIFEALPFDRRVGLWQAMTPQAWIAAAGVKNGQEVGTQLVSIHEFGHSFPQFVNPGNDTFMTMVLVSHNGKERTQADIRCLASKEETAKFEQELARILYRSRPSASGKIVTEMS